MATGCRGLRRRGQRRPDRSLDHRRRLRPERNGRSGIPPTIEECIAVGSVNADQPHFYGVSYFSSRAAPRPTDARSETSKAPGERIRSCNSNFNVGQKNLYREDSGTSSMPHVSGLLAAFLSVRRSSWSPRRTQGRALAPASTSIMTATTRATASQPDAHAGPRPRESGFSLFPRLFLPPPRAHYNRAGFSRA